jgi:hypothetical protein
VSVICVILIFTENTPINNKIFLQYISTTYVMNHLLKKETVKYIVQNIVKDRVGIIQHRFAVFYTKQSTTLGLL